MVVPHQVKTLVHLVARGYYSGRAKIILEILTRHIAVPEDYLTDVFRTTPKDLSKTCNQLCEDGLIRLEMRLEAHPDRPDRKHRQRPYWYIDYKRFVDVLKFRMHKMTRALESEVAAAEVARPYGCTLCGKMFNPLDMLAVIQPDDMMPHCDVCGTLLVEADADGNLSARYTRFMSETATLLALLKEVDRLSVPEYIP
ncbi:hypothetical protein CXG81DRAFT_8734, partial [Caulochytrium protostelioides]